MIIIFQNEKIVAIDKKLLQILDCTLTDISEKISQFNLALNSLKKTTIQIDNKSFNIKEIETININNFYVYKLEEIKTEQLNSFAPLEEIPSISPLEKELTLEIEPKEETDLKTNSLENSFDLNISSSADEEKPEEISIDIKPETSEKLLLKTEPEEISITFEDEFEEIEKILALNNQEAKTLILEDLQQAANDFEMDIDSIKELYSDLINQIETNKENFYNAIKTKDYEQMHKISHSLKGASLNLRLSNIALILKTIDEKSKEHISFDKLEFLVNNFYTFVDKIKEFDMQTENSTVNEIPEFLRELILDSIKNYVATQNEKKLKKDLKYIEKLLNTKINSIEELQAILKGKK